MPFPKFEIAKYPPRQWAGFGFPGTGKSGFSVMLRGPLLVIDSDQRFSQTMRECRDRSIPVDAHRLSANAQDNVEPSRIAELLDANMPGSEIGTISIDSLTTIITPKVVKAIVDKDEGREKNLSSAFKPKAMAMRQLQDACTKWGSDIFWIWHLNESRTGDGSRSEVKETLSKTERIRIGRSLNLRLQFIQERGKFGVKVVWARYGRSGMTLWDDAGNFWKGMPERVEAAVYDGLSEAERAALEKEPPECFPDDETAIGWGFERGPFRVVEHARNAFDKLKRESGFTTLADLTPLWIADVERRLEEGEEQEEEESEAHAPTQSQLPEPPGPATAATKPIPQGHPSGANGKGHLAGDPSTKFWNWVNEHRIPREHALNVMNDTGANYDEAQRRLEKEAAVPVKR